MEIFGGKRETIKGNQDKGFDAEIKAFVNAVCTGGEQPIPPAEIVETTLVTFAIHQALNTGIVIQLESFAAQSGISVIG